MSDYPDPFTDQPLRVATGIARGLALSIVTIALIALAIWAGAR